MRVYTAGIYSAPFHRNKYLGNVVSRCINAGYIKGNNAAGISCLDTVNSYTITNCINIGIVEGGNGTTYPIGPVP